ncbi:LysR family transcriptional regulator [Thioclava sp. BHET1]|nr:LysR family transcriptional regulator [Thioclava sp. BHET1]
MADPTAKSPTLRGLEVFDELARTGSMQEAAKRLGLSAPAASQQLRNLETALGHALIDHGRRPLSPTRAGRAYLAHLREALRHLRQGAEELAMIGIGGMSALRLGIIDDFDNEVTPRLTVALAGVLTPCDLTLVTAPSHLIHEDLAQGRVDVGLAASPPQLPSGVMELPLLRDPFLLAVPRGYISNPPQSLDQFEALPFLRYERSQLIARQIAAQLARLKIAPRGRIEMDSNQAVFGLIGNGAGWTITTALSYLRARRFHAQVDIHPLPFAGFSRRISLLHGQDLSPELVRIIAGALRGILQSEVLEPGQHALGPIAPGLALLAR